MRERAEAALLLTSTSAAHCNPVCRTRILPLSKGFDEPARMPPHSSATEW
jgi:hypothetical protein